jgi:Leucine-rich repeat (LRR) protein
VTNYFKDSELYACQAHDLVVTGTNEKISSIDGKHGDEKTNADVERFEIFRQKVFFLPTGIKKFFPLLKELIVNMSKLREIERKSFDNMTTLEVVLMSNNRIYSISEDTFYDLIELKVLKLSQNQLKSLPLNLLIRQKKLEVFNIVHNQVNEIPKGFFKNNLELTKIWVAKNNLTVIDTADMFNMKKLDEVKLNENVCIDEFYKEIKQENLSEIKEKCSKKFNGTKIDEKVKKEKGKASMININLFLFVVVLMLKIFGF